MDVLGASSGLVWTRQQALQVMTAAQVATALRRGEWQQPRRGVYADGGGELDAGQRAFAAVLASGGAGQPSPVPGVPSQRRLRAVACGRTAARVHGLVLIDDRDPATGAREEPHDHVRVLTQGSALRRTQPDGSVRVLHRHELTLARGDVVLMPNGLYVTSVLRTVADCAALLLPEALVCLLDDVVHRGALTPVELAAVVDGRRWCAGAVALRTASRSVDGRAESPAETLARLLLRPVLPGLVPQVVLRDRGRVLARLDLGEEALRLGVESDGRRGHAGEPMVAKDKRRDRACDALGWRVERFTWFDLRRRRSEVVSVTLGAAEAQRRRHRLA